MSEGILPNAPNDLGKVFLIKSYCDSDHMEENLTCWSRSGFVMMLNTSTLYWFSKKHISVETSTFGSEFVDLKQWCEYIRGLRYKLWMIGIPLEDPTFIYCDNQSVVMNASLLDSTLKNKINSIAYHFFCKGSAIDEWRCIRVGTGGNP